jgi:hypothetical protein
MVVAFAVCPPTLLDKGVAIVFAMAVARDVMVICGGGLAVWVALLVDSGGGGGGHGSDRGGGVGDEEGCKVGGQGGCKGGGRVVLIFDSLTIILTINVRLSRTSTLS